MTKRDVAKLKEQWLSNPTWDIETTEGYEKYHKELKQFSDEYKKRLIDEEDLRITDLARCLNLRDNLDLLLYIDKLEQRIVVIEEKLSNLGERY